MDLDDPSALAALAADACVARLPAGEGSRKSAVLVARHLGVLAAHVMFRGHPVPGLKVSFGRVESAQDESPEAMEPEVSTDENGLAVFPRLVTTGVYACDIETQPRTYVPTSPSLTEPHPVVLPVGRPLVDVGDTDEFLPHALRT